MSCVAQLNLFRKAWQCEPEQARLLLDRSGGSSLDLSQSERPGPPEIEWKSPAIRTAAEPTLRLPC